MTLEELYRVQADNNKLKSLYLELAEHRQLNPYKANTISDMPRGGNAKKIMEWYVEEKDRIEREIRFWQEKLQQDREELMEYIKHAPYPECDIIQYRAVNGLGWSEIGNLLKMDRRTASRKFYRYVKLPTMPADM